MIFKKNYIYETIIKIDAKDGKIFVPMGIKYLGTKNGTKRFEICIFKNTNTARLLTEKNLTERCTFTCIFTSDICCFYECITKKFSDKFIHKIEKFPKVVFEIEKIEDIGEKLRVTSIPRSMGKDIERKIKKNLLNRAKSLALESLICYTKPINHNVKKNRISEMLRVIKKVAPNSEYERIVSNILLLEKE